MRLFRQRDFLSRLPDPHAAKLVVAAVIAYLAARALTRGSGTLIAPLTALLVSQVTVLETLTSGLRRVIAVVAGVVLAIAFAMFVALTWWSLALLLAVAYLIGGGLRLDDYSNEVAISAMLVFAVGGAHATASARIVETLVGAAVGIGFNLVAVRPRIRPAGNALRGLAGRIAAVLESAAGDLRSDWSPEAAQRVLADARRLSRDIEHADDAFAAAERSLRLNPRAARFKVAAPSLRAALAALEHAALSVRELARTLADRSQDDLLRHGVDVPDRQTLAELLDGVAAAARAFGSLAVGDMAGPSGSDADLRAALAQARDVRSRLTAQFAVDAWEEPRLWTLHGALLQATDRILHELDPAAGSDARRVPRGGRSVGSVRSARTAAAVRTRAALGRAAVAAQRAAARPSRVAGRAVSSDRAVSSGRAMSARRALRESGRVLTPPLRRRTPPPRHVRGGGAHG